MEMSITSISIFSIILDAVYFLCKYKYENSQNIFYFSSESFSITRTLFHSSPLHLMSSLCLAYDFVCNENIIFFLGWRKARSNLALKVRNEVFFKCYCRNKTRFCIDVIAYRHQSSIRQQYLICKKKYSYKFFGP